MDRRCFINLEDFIAPEVHWNNNAIETSPHYLDTYALIAALAGNRGLDGYQKKDSHASIC